MGTWSELCIDILSCVFERLSFVDIQRAKMVCSNWFLCSKQKLLPKSGSPWLILFPEDGGCVMYNPDEEDRIYKSKRDFSKIRILGNSGKWLLVLDPKSNLYIIDAFSDKKIELPPLESFKGSYYSHERIGDKEFKVRMPGSYYIYQNAYNLRGLLWVDDEKGDYVVVWYFKGCYYIGFCKNGEDHHTEIQTEGRERDLRGELRGRNDMVLVGQKLYILTFRSYIRVLDLSLSVQEGSFKDVSPTDKFPMRHPPVLGEDEDRSTYDAYEFTTNIAVTTSGEVLLVVSTVNREMRRIWHIYKRDIYMEELVELTSLDDEALFLDLGIIRPADSTLGIEPNSVYFTRGDRFRASGTFSLDISVSHLAKQTNNRFPHLSSLNLKDARWFLPS